MELRHLRGDKFELLIHDLPDLCQSSPLLYIQPSYDRLHGFPSFPRWNLIERTLQRLKIHGRDQFEDKAGELMIRIKLSNTEGQAELMFEGGGSRKRVS